MAQGNGKDLIAILVHDVEQLKVSSRETTDEMAAMSEGMSALSVRMTSLSETMAEVAKTMGVMANAMSQQAVRVRGHEKLYGRLAKTLIAFKASSDDRFDRLEKRMKRVERHATRH